MRMQTTASRCLFYLFSVRRYSAAVQKIKRLSFEGLRSQGVSFAPTEVYVSAGGLILVDSLQSQSRYAAFLPLFLGANYSMQG